MSTTPETRQIAGRDSDPHFYAALSILPNPDPILRRLGRADEVYDTIERDSHVIGELRQIQAALQRYKHTLVPGGDSRKEKRAYEICMGVLNRPPAPHMTWPQVFWNIAKSPFRGMTIHEIVWMSDGGLWLPECLLDKPKRRFVFNAMGELRVIGRSDPMQGVPAEDAYFLVDRHMPSYDNPYGIALLSSCFWWYQFKHKGAKWFVQFCERVGIPFPIGEFVAGSSQGTIDQLEKALAEMLDAGYAAIEEGGKIKLLEASNAAGAGKLAQHQLIEVCNAEMSKALTSQTLATEQNTAGSRAAASVAQDRSDGNVESMRECVAYTLDKLWRLITEFNVGKDVAPPRSEFTGESKATLARAQIYKAFMEAGGNPSRKAMAAELGITLADEDDPDDQLRAQLSKSGAPAGAGSSAGTGKDDEPVEFSLGPSFEDQAALDRAIQLFNAADYSQVMLPLLKPLLSMIDTSPEQALTRLSDAYPDMDQGALAEKLTRMLFVADTWGRLTATDG